MISVNRAKRLIAAVGLLIAALVGLVVVRQAGAALLDSATGADATSIFNDIPPAPADVSDGLEWLPDANDGRVMEPATRDAITDAYSRAVAAIDRAGRGDPDAPIADYLSGPALAAARSALDRSTADVSVATLSVTQQLRLDFYSDDGSVVAIGVPSAEMVRVVDDDATRHRTIVATTEERRFVMLLEDGNWRVLQNETVAAEPVVPSPPSAPLEGRLDGVNAPSVYAGDPTWRSFDPEWAEGELDLVERYGFDSVRVFVAGPEFETVDVDALAAFLDQADDRGIGVVVTLFDGSADHSVARWGDDRGYVDRIVAPLAGHPAIALWDVKNEPDLDDVRSGGAAVVDAWIARTVAHVRDLDDDTPITVGWSASEHALRQVDAVDVVSFHHFTAPDDLSAALLDVAAGAGERAVLVSEYGTPEWVGPVRGDQPHRQATVVDELRDASSAASGGAMVWQLRDPVEAVEEGVVAARASTTYGLVRPDGTERPLAAVFDDRPIPAPTLVERLRAAVPTMVLLTLALAAIGSAMGWWSRRRRAVDEPPEPLTDS